MRGWPSIAARAYLQRMQRDAQTEHRLLGLAGGAAAVLLVLGSVFGYLKLDTMTRGYYTRRLQFAAALVILTVVAGMLVGVRSSGPQGEINPPAIMQPPPTVPAMPLNVTRLPAN